MYKFSNVLNHSPVHVQQQTKNEHMQEHVQVKHTKSGQEAARIDGENRLSTDRKDKVLGAWGPQTSYDGEELSLFFANMSSLCRESLNSAETENTHFVSPASSSSKTFRRSAVAKCRFPPTIQICQGSRREQLLDAFHPKLHLLASLKKDCWRPPQRPTSSRHFETGT